MGNRIQDSTTIYKDLVEKARRYRLEYPMTQKELADKSGVSLRSIQYFEKGKDIQLSIFIKILIALDLSKNISVLIPDMNERPSVLLAKDKSKLRKRATHRKGNTESVFKWGDEK